MSTEDTRRPDAFREAQRHVAGLTARAEKRAPRLAPPRREPGSVLNWLGNSLDGTLARHGGVERPRFGFYVDHLADAFGALFVLGGLALSGLMSPLVAAGVVTAYFLLAIETYLATYTIGRFEVSHGPFGGTELRILLAIANRLDRRGGSAIAGVMEKRTRYFRGLFSPPGPPRCITASSRPRAP
jgi:hypothetical protein